MCISDYIQTWQTTFLYLRRFMKKLPDDPFSSVTKSSIYHFKHISIQRFTWNWMFIGSTYYNMFDIMLFLLCMPDTSQPHYWFALLEIRRKISYISILAVLTNLRYRKRDYTVQRQSGNSVSQIKIPIRKYILKKKIFHVLRIQFLPGY